MYNADFAFDASVLQNESDEGAEDQNLVTSEKWKSRTFMAGTTISKASSPVARPAGPSDSTLRSISISDWLKRKLRTAEVTRPFSTRNSPSRVMPVITFSYGSTSRMYHKRVTRRPRSVEAIIFSSDESPPEKTRFIGASPYSLGSAKPWPVGCLRARFAVLRAYTRFFGTPRSTSKTRWRGMP